MNLLITARDPATAVSFYKLLPDLLQNKQMNCRLFCQPPACQILEDFNNQVKISEVSDTEMIVAEFNSFQPDAVLTGISGPDTGVDETVLLLAKEHGITSYALQSFWGDINQKSQAVPDIAFVLDDEAQKITQQHYPQIRCIPIGSIKHIDYHHYDALQKRKQIRKALQLEGELVLGFYGQPILNVPSYFKTIEAMVRQLKCWDRDFKLIYRPHPKESESLQQKTMQLFQAAFVEKVSLDSSYSIKDSLVACDLVISAFSTCGFDNLYLNEMADYAFNTSVYLWFEPELIKWWQDYSHLELMPLITEDLLLAVDKEDKLLDVLEQGLLKETQQRLRENAKQHLPDPSEGINHIIKELNRING